jgi:hypothetical protein
MEDMSIVDDHVAINGIQGIDYMGGTNMSSSAGYPYSGPKAALFKGERPNASLGDELQSDIDDMVSCFESGRAFGAVTKASLKTEIVDTAKFEAKKTRVFSCVPYPLIHLQKRLLMTMSRVMFGYRNIFETAVGINMNSAEVGDLVDNVKQLGNRKNVEAFMIAGDFEGFDKRMCPVVLIELFWLFYDLLTCEYSGMKDDSRILPWMRGLLAETLFGYGTYDGNIFRRMLGMISGFLYTSVFGAGYQSMTKRALYAICHYYGKVFRKGPLDDWWVDEFPQIAETITWDVVNDASFRANFDESMNGEDGFEENVVVTAFGDDHWDSLLTKLLSGKIYKVLYWNLYGMGYTDANKDPIVPAYNMFADITFLKRYMLWNDDVSDWVAILVEKSRAKGLDVRVKGAGSELDGHKSCFESSMTEAWPLGREYYDKHVGFLRSTQAKYFPYLPILYKTYEEQIAAWHASSERLMRTGQVIRCGRKMVYSSRRDRAYVKGPVDEEVQEVVDIEPLSDVFRVDACMENVPISQIGESVVVMPDVAAHSYLETKPEDEVPNVAFSSWFDRPRQIRSGKVEESLDSFDPWTEYFCHPGTVPKVSGHLKFRATLNVRITMTSSAFVAGRLFVAYDPLFTKFDSTKKFGAEDLVKMNCVELDVGRSESAILTFPMVWTRDYVEWKDLGKLGRVHFDLVGQRLIGTPDKPHMRIDMWAEDVELADAVAPSGDGLPSRVIVTPLVGRVVGENYEIFCKDGKLSVIRPSKEDISKMDKWPRMTIERTRKYLEVPSEVEECSLNYARNLINSSVGELMTSSLIHNGVSLSPDEATAKFGSELARRIESGDTQIFGQVCLALGVPDPEETRFRPWPDTASAASTPKFSQFTPTVGGGLSDLADDSLLSYLQTEEIVFNGDWETGSMKAIFDRKVKPVSFKEVGKAKAMDGFTYRRVSASYLSYFTWMSRRWKGSLVYRFRIIRTQHHCGKIAIYLRRSPESTLEDSFSVIVDISEVSEFDIEVPYMETTWTTTPACEDNSTYSNLVVVPYSPMVAPEASAVRVMISIRAGDDYVLDEVYPRPDHMLIDLKPFGAQMVESSVLEAARKVEYTVGKPKRQVPRYVLGVGPKLSIQAISPLSKVSDFCYKEMEYSATLPGAGQYSVNKFGVLPSTPSFARVMGCFKAWHGDVTRHLVVSSDSVASGAVILGETYGVQSEPDLSFQMAKGDVVGSLNKEIIYVSKYPGFDHFSVARSEHSEKYEAEMRVAVMSMSSSLLWIQTELSNNFRMLVPRGPPDFWLRTNSKPKNRVVNSGSSVAGAAVHSEYSRFTSVTHPIDGSRKFAYKDFCIATEDK